MNFDTFWQIFRYGLLIGGGYLASKGLVDRGSLEGIITAIGTLAVAGWGIYVKSGTQAVPTATVTESQVNPAIPTIPTVSAATGNVKD